MLILVLDSCGSSCGVGVFKDGRLLTCLQERMERGQDASLMPMVEAVMKKAGVAYADIDKVAVTRGPGSFTGVRVGLAAARGIGFASEKPVIGIDRFSIYKSLHAAPNKNLLVVIESKRAELFCKFYPTQGAALDASMMTEKEIRDFIAAHPNAEIAGDIATPNDDILSACASLAASADAENPDTLPRPLYLRAPDVTFADKTACGEEHV
ncbi:MAG: tRNA (adenosine(37)-N6)-threonylcarbamoyltransferase complex dimerization subunit type 1 TsaB [Bdellovibrionales bacterium]